jgi:heptosyltransferase-2/heptosyltransferase-3
MLATNPHIDTLLTLPFPGFVRGGAQHQKPHSRLHPYRLLLSSAALLRAGHFDTALLLRDDHWWGAALTLLAGIPRRVGHAVPECRPFLTTALPWDATEHVTVQALQVVEALHHTQSHRQAEHNRTVPGKIPLTFEPAADERAWAQGWLEQHGVVVRSAGDSMYAVQTSPRLVVLHPGTGGATKLWPVERWGVVGNVLTAECGVQLLLTGGPGEEPLVDTLASMIHPRPLTLVGSARIGQLAALLCLATLVIGVDSGPLHIAVSQRSATIHLYGPSDDRRFGPWGDRTWHSVLRSGLWCRPCHVFQACPRATNPPECMTAITVEHVLHAARTLLNRLPEI